MGVVAPGVSPGKKMWADTHGERGARTYNGGLGTKPPAGSRGRVPSRVVTGAKTPEAVNLLAFGCPTEAANLPHSPYFSNSLNSRYL